LPPSPIIFDKSKHYCTRFSTRHATTVNVVNRENIPPPSHFNDFGSSISRSASYFHQEKHQQPISTFDSKLSMHENIEVNEDDHRGREPISTRSQTKLYSTKKGRK